MTKYYFKVYLKNNDSSVKEVRRFEMGHEFKNYVLNFKTLCDKLTHYFPELRDNAYTISWIDHDNDLIRITSDEELDIAVRSMHPDGCKLHIKLQPQTQEVPTSGKQEIIHSGIICDGCDGDIIGFRYKCIQCEDYDLCSQCETLGLHSDHCMIRMPQPLHWSSFHGRRLLHHMRKFLKKNGINLGTEDVPDECPMKGKKCHEFSAHNINVFPWLEAFAPYFNAFNDTKTEPQSSNKTDPSKDVPKEEDKKNPTARVGIFKMSKEDLKQFLDPLGLDIDIEISSGSPNQNNKPDEQKEKSKENAGTDEDTSTNFSEEERKLIEKTKKNLSASDAASVIIQNTSAKKAAATAADEWTFVDRSEASDISHASSVSSNLNEIPANQVRPTAPSAPSASKETPSEQTIYPQLPKEEEKVYHPNPKVQRALETMIGMGFSNKGGLLTYLLQAEDGNINKVLDLLQSTDN